MKTNPLVYRYTFFKIGYNLSSKFWIYSIR